MKNDEHKRVFNLRNNRKSFLMKENEQTEKNEYN